MDVSVYAQQQSKIPSEQHQSFLKLVQQEDVKKLTGEQSLAMRLNNSKADHAVFFIASWCGYCKTEIDYYLKKVNSGTCSRVSFVSIDENEIDIRAYLNKNQKLKTPVYLDTQKKLKNFLKLDQVPFVVYLGRDKTYFKTSSGSNRMHSMIDFIVADGEGRNGACK